MAGHAQLKFVMTECSKTQIRLTRLMSSVLNLILYEPHQGKTRLLRLRPGKTQTCMDQLASFNFLFSQYRHCFQGSEKQRRSSDSGDAGRFSHDVAHVFLKGTNTPQNVSFCTIELFYVTSATSSNARNDVFYLLMMITGEIKLYDTLLSTFILHT